MLAASRPAACSAIVREQPCTQLISLAAFCAPRPQTVTVPARASLACTACTGRSSLLPLPAVTPLHHPHLDRRRHRRRHSSRLGSMGGTQVVAGVAGVLQAPGGESLTQFVARFLVSSLVMCRCHSC